MLHELQKAFLRHYYKKKDDFLNNLQPHQSLSSQEQFGIYAGSITECLIKSLRENFPVTYKLVGEDFFRYMAFKYIQQYPSTSPNLGDYGDSFSNFVASFPDAQCLPYLADVCTLEWYWQKVYNGPDYSPIDLIKLSQIDQSFHAFIHFKQPANSYLLQSNYPIKAIWEINQNDEIDEIEMKEKHDFLLIWRPKMDVIISDLTEAQWFILNAFTQGLTLGEVSNQFEGRFDLSNEIPKIVAEGWFTDFELKN